MTDEVFEELGILTAKDRDWLLGKINVSKPCEYRLRSGIRKKLQTLAKFELPLISNSGLLDTVPNYLSYYDLKDQSEPALEFGYGTYYNDNPSLGEAKVPGPNPGQGFLLFGKGARNEDFSNSKTLQLAVRTLQYTVRLPRQRSTRLSYQTSNDDTAKVLSSCNNDHWNGYKEFLLQNYNPHTAKVRLLYSKKYCHVLETGNARELLILSNDKRIHIMKALASMSKYLGCHDKWNDIREKDQLRCFGHICRITITSTPLRV